MNIATRRPIAFAVMLAAFVFVGCAYSLQQVAPEDSAVFDPNLLGRWQMVAEDSPKGSILVTSSDQKTYEVTGRDDDKPVTYTDSLRLFRLNGNLFYDRVVDHVRTANVSIDSRDIAALPLHSIGRIWIQSDEVRACELSADWLRKNLASLNPPLQHLPVDENSLIFKDVILTGAPAEIRDFAAMHADDRDAFPVSMIFRRPPKKKLK
jgi:hypothetical protein